MAQIHDYLPQQHFCLPKVLMVLFVWWPFLGVWAKEMPEFARQNQTTPVYERIVSLDLCMDWLLAYYADPAQVTALSPLHRRFPLPIQSQNWPVHDGSLEQIVSLKADLVVVGEFNALLLRSRLERLGHPVKVLSLPRSLEEVEIYLNQFFQLLGLTASKRIAEDQWPREFDKDAPRLLLLGANGVGTGQQTFEDQLLTQAGWQNYVLASGYVRLDLEQLAIDPPDAILWSAPESAALANQFAQHPVLSKLLPASGWLSIDYWRWQCPGPWTYELIDQLAELRKALE